MISDPSFNSLTKEEQQITRLMVGGIPDHVIANHMRMNLQEVLVFQKNISKTLAFSNPTDILKFAVRTGIINIDDW